MLTAIWMLTLLCCALLFICIALGRRIDVAQKRIDNVHERLSITLKQNGLKDFWQNS